MNLISKSVCNYSFTINAIIGCIFHNFYLTGLTPYLIPKLGSNRGMSTYDYTNIFLYLSMEINSCLLFPINDFSNWTISVLLGSSLKSTSIVSLINTWDPYSPWFGIGIQFLSLKLYSSSSPRYWFSKVVFTVKYGACNMVSMYLNSFIVGYLEINIKFIDSSSIYTYDEEPFEISGLNNSKSSLPNHSKYIVSKASLDISAISTMLLDMSSIDNLSKDNILSSISCWPITSSDGVPKSKFFGFNSIIL